MLGLKPEACLPTFRHCWKGLLQLAQVHALEDPSPETFAEEQSLNQKWQFFFRVCLSRASFNAVRSFLLLSGVLLTDPLQMSNHAVEHFKSVLGPNRLNILVASPPDWFQRLTPFQCSLSQSATILLMPTSAEITKLMFSLNPSK